MAKYKIKHTSIMHNGNLYKEGDVIELTEKQAKRLEDFVNLVPEKKASQNENKTQNTNKNTSKNKTKTENQTVIKEGGNNDNK